MAVTAIVCGPAGASGVTYAVVSGQPVTCGTDSAGNTLELQVSTLQGDQPVTGGEAAGLQIGGAILGVLAVAWCIKALRRQIETSGEA